MSFVLTLVLILVIQYALSIFFQSIGFNFFIADTLVNFVLAFVFSYIRFYKLRLAAFKNLYFHRSVLTYFIVLMVFSLIEWFILF